jgi:hypothetical protein
MQPLGGVRRSWGPDFMCVEGSFAVQGGAIVSVLNTTRSPKPHNITGFTLTYNVAGVYGVTLQLTAVSLVRATVAIGPGAAFTGTAVPTAQPVAIMITQDFMKYSAGNLVTDTTGTIVTIVSTNAGALTDVTNTYRVVFEVVLAMSALNS